MERFGGIDILVNKASAIWLRGTLDTPMKRFDCGAGNSRGVSCGAQACLPHLCNIEPAHLLLRPSTGSQMLVAAYRLHPGDDGHEFVTRLAASSARRAGDQCLWPRTLIAREA